MPGYRSQSTDFAEDADLKCFRAGDEFQLQCFQEGDQGGALFVVKI